MSSQNIGLYLPLSPAVAGLNNCRVKYALGKNGELFPFEICCFDTPIFNNTKFQKVKKAKKGFMDFELLSESENFIFDCLEYDYIDINTVPKEHLISLILKRYEELKSKKDNRKNVPVDYVEKSRRRAIKKVYDYKMADFEFDCMVTLTFSSEKVNRIDFDDVYKNISAWLSNRVQRKKMKYILIPEYHTDGAIHFHGFCNSSALSLKPTKYKRDNKGNNYISALYPNRKGKRIYNISDFDYGFSTVIKLGKTPLDHEKSLRYVLKYITKQERDEKIGGRWYYSGGDIQKPICEYFDCNFGFDYPTVNIEGIPNFKIVKGYTATRTLLEEKIQKI